MALRVRYHVPEDMKESFRLKRIDNGDWIDLRNSEPVNLPAGVVFNIPLGVAIELPEGYEAYIAPRSSILERYGLVGIFSIIDNSYKGDDDIWHLPVYTTRPVEIPAGARIAQFRLMDKMTYLRIEEVEELGNPNRGGLGSTGVH